MTSESHNTFLPNLIRNNRKLLRFALRFSDFVWIIAGFAAACYATNTTPTYVHVVVGVVTCVLFFVIANLMALYRSWRLAHLALDSLMTVTSWILAINSMIIALFATDLLALFPRFLLFDWLVATGVLFLVSRLILQAFFRELRRYGRNVRKVAVIGASKNGLQIADLFDRSPWMGMSLVGILDQRCSERLNQDHPHLQASISIGQIIDFVKRENIDVVYIALPIQAAHRIRHLVDNLADTTVSIYLMPDFSEFTTLYTRLEMVGDMPTFGIVETPMHGGFNWIKTIEDYVLGIIFLLVALVPMIFITIAIKLTSPGPAIFRQKRYGLDGNEIEIYKFRSMNVAAEGADAKQATRNDPRVTRLGAFLRRTSLDELPQFINVLEGKMSIIGPRPHPIPLNEKFRKRISGYMLRHKMKPGIAGWAQVNGYRGETDTEDKMNMRIEYDLEYIRSWSLWLDIKIIFLAVLRGFNSENAY